MPQNREPRIYPGYVISMIGQNAGQRMEMEFKNAQASVAAGTARWHDDETDMSPALRRRIEERDAATAAQIEADRIHNENMKLKALEDAGKAKSIEALIAGAARPLVVAKFGDVLYLARPFPAVTKMHREILDTDEVAIIDGATDADDAQNGDIVFTVNNAIGRYRPVSEEDDIITAQLQESVMPEVDIPADWRDLHHFKMIPLAKAVIGADAPMKKDEAVGILEEWTKQDDQVQAGDAGKDDKAADQGKGTDASQGFKDANGNPISAEERARQAAEELAKDGEND